MFLISKKSKQLFMAAGLALGIVALGACSGGGGSIQSPVAPNQPASPAGTWSQTLSPAGMSANLPSVAGFSETLTVPANNASAGTTLTVKVSGSVPAGLPAIDPDLHMVKSFLYFTISTSKTVTLNGVPGFTLVAPPHFDYGNFHYYNKDATTQNDPSKSDGDYPSFNDRWQIMREVMTANDDGGKRIWVTETGWPTQPRHPGGTLSVTDPQTEATYWQYELQAAKSSGVIAKIFFYTIASDHTLHSAVNNDIYPNFPGNNRPLPAFDVYKSFVAQNPVWGT